MSRATIRGRFFAVFAPMVGLFTCVMVTVGRGDPPRSNPAQDPKKEAAQAPLTLLWDGVRQCETCHRESPNTRTQITDFVGLNEVDIWSKKDKHSDAFANLKNSVGLQMSAKMGYDATKDGRCLSCHSPGFKTPEIAAATIEEGVSCVSCHGPYQEWQEAHGGGAIRKNQEKWIHRSAKDKHDNFGMNDLRDPAVRAEVCASCHIGDKEKGRVVTHSMYAAGHPPLPGIEVVTFSGSEPPHWMPMKNVPYFQKLDPQKPEDNKLLQDYGIDQSATQYAKLVAVGGVVSFRKAMELFATTAKATGVPDFARFDCSACHHELRVSEKSYRQLQGFGASEPGRPPVAKWPTMLAELAIDAGNPGLIAKRKDQLWAGLAALHEAVGSRPFGNADKSIAAAQSLIVWANSFILALDSTKFDPAASLRMLHTITKIKPPDYASARQLIWGFQAIYDELDPKPANDAQIKEALNKLIDGLKIRLKPGEKSSINRDLGARLEADELYDPSSIVDSLRQLGKLLP